MGFQPVLSNTWSLILGTARIDIAIAELTEFLHGVGRAEARHVGIRGGAHVHVHSHSGIHRRIYVAAAGFTRGQALGHILLLSCGDGCPFLIHQGWPPHTRINVTTYITVGFHGRGQSLAQESLPSCANKNRINNKPMRKRQVVPSHACTDWMLFVSTFWFKTHYYRGRNFYHGPAYHFRIPFELRMFLLAMFTLCDRGLRYRHRYSTPVFHTFNSSNSRTWKRNYVTNFDLVVYS